MIVGSQQPLWALVSSPAKWVRVDQDIGAYTQSSYFSCLTPLRAGTLPEACTVSLEGAAGKWLTSPPFSSTSQSMAIVFAKSLETLPTLGPTPTSYTEQVLRILPSTGRHRRNISKAGGVSTNPASGFAHVP